MIGHSLGWMPSQGPTVGFVTQTGAKDGETLPETPLKLVKAITFSLGPSFERGFFQMVQNHSGYTVQGETRELHI